MQDKTNDLDAPGDLFLWNKLFGIKLLFGLLLCLSAGLTANAAPSNLDPTFGTLGKVLSSPDGTQKIFQNATVLQPDGKIVMVGARSVGSSYIGFIVVRYNANGSLDTTFGTNGWSSATFGMEYEVTAAVDLQADGKIVVGGSLRPIYNAPSNQFGVMRFNTDGSLDTTFNGNGKLIIDFNDLIGVFYTEYLGALKVGSDGKIIAAGRAQNSGVDNKFVFARINTDGTLDSTFGTNGKASDVTGGQSNYDAIYDMVILPDGKFVVAAFIVGFVNTSGQAIKYHANGGREWTYEQTSPMSSSFPESLNGIAVQSDGKFVVVGRHLTKVAAFRVNANGTADNTFAGVGGMPAGTAVSVAVQTDGKVVASLSANTFSLVRFNANGSLETTFGTGGFVSTSISGDRDYARKVFIQPDKKILLGGISQVGSPTAYYFTLARYLGDSASVVNRPLFDYDGDGRADVSVFRPSENKWYILQSSNFALIQTVFAVAGDIAAPGDYDGDGKTDVAIFRPSSGQWWYQSSINNAQVNVGWGQSGDIPRPSDFDGDGKTDFIVYRPANSVWYRYGSMGATSILAFGIAEDKPLVGDFDGDGKTDQAIFRPSTGDWWYAASSAGEQFRTSHWGAAGDLPVPADYDGDGKTDFAVFRPSNGGWYILSSSNGSVTAQGFGLTEDKPIAADYDGDDKADIAVFRPSTGTWYLQQTTTGFGALPFGSATDLPTEGAFIP